MCTYFDLYLQGVRNNGEKCRPYYAVVAMTYRDEDILGAQVSVLTLIRVRGRAPRWARARPRATSPRS